MFVVMSVKELKKIKKMMVAAAQNMDLLRVS